MTDTGPVPPSPPPSTLRTVLMLVGIVAVAVVAGIGGVPMVAVIIGASGIGAAMFLRDMNARRVGGAHDIAGDSIADYPLQLPAERVAVGRLVQIRLLPPTRSVWAPGLLCVRPGHARFVPSKAKFAARAWEGSVERAEVHSLPSSVAVVRLHGGADGQFVVQRPSAEVDAALRTYVAVQD